MIDFKYETKKMNEMRDYFNKELPRSLYYTHYDLAAIADSPSHNSQEWKEFLMHPHTAAYISTEVQTLQQVELRKIVKDISSRSSSVGVAQTLSALMKALETGQVREGPAYIYSYIPLTPDELNAPNVLIVDGDPFLEGEEDESNT